MDMLEADLGVDAAQYSDLIAKVRNNPIVAPQMSQEQLERQADGEAFYAAEQLLIRTDYLFSVDRHATLLTDEPLREAELKASREAARETIRAYKVKYQPLP